MTHITKLRLQLSIKLEIDTESHPEDINVKEFKRIISEQFGSQIGENDIFDAIRGYEILEVEPIE